MTIQRHFKLALTAGHTIPLVINANQYDSGEQWLFTLYNDGVRYTPSSGAIVGIKADRLGIINTGTVDANGRVVINETRQMTAAVGKNIFELLIDDQTHGTANFMVLVEPRPGDNADLSESDYSLFEEAIQGTSQTAIKAGVQEWMDENLTDPTDPIVDASLSLSGAAADAKKTGDEISELKSALSYAVNTVHTEQSTDILPNITWTEGYYVAPNGAINTSSTNKYSNKIAVQEGDIVSLLPANSAFRWICAYNGETAVAESGTQNVSSYTVPSGIDGLILTAYVSSTYAPTAVYIKRTVTEYINVNDAEIEDISDRLESVEEVIKTESYIDDVVESIMPSMTVGAVATTGATVAYQDFEYTQKITVTEGALIEAISNGASVNIRFLCAYNGNVAMRESGSNTDILNYTVPSGIDGIIVTVRKSNNVDTIRVTTPTGKVGAYVKPIPLGFMAESGSLSSGDKLTLPYMQVKLYNRIVFNANVSNFSSIFYSMGDVKVEVDSTNLLITNGSGTALTPVPHGLTIGRNITLIIENETEEYISHVRVCSDGNVFDYTSKFYAPSANANQYVQSSGSVLTECVLSWVSQNINAPIWIFGDSYLSLYNVRWTYYLIQDGYTKNVMLNGYAGQASATDYNALVNLLKTTTPKMVVWCLGMNDSDTSNAVNESWKTIYDKVIERQKEYGFELVLYTVPTTPTMNNRFKDAIVRESGYRYIEADKAVRINDSGDWISGTLNSDNVHPTETGAKVLYNRILADLPEIMCNR